MRLALYDLLGRERDVLLDYELAPGAYEVVWDATGVASGHYLSSMRAGSVVRTRLLTLAK